MTLKQVLVKINDKNKIKCQSLRFNLKITMAVFNVTHCLMLYEDECVCVCVKNSRFTWGKYIVSTYYQHFLMFHGMKLSGPTEIISFWHINL